MTTVLHEDFSDLDTDLRKTIPSSNMNCREHCAPEVPKREREREMASLRLSVT